MKKLFTALAVVLTSICVFAQRDSLTVLRNMPTNVRDAGKVAHVEVLSSVSSGTATVKRVRELTALRDDITTTYATNTTYSLVYSNGTDIVTNTVAIDYSPFPANMQYISYTTNVNVTATSVTNIVPYIAATVTNDLCETITCSGGVGSKDPTGKYIFPGDKVFFTGTATGKVEIILER